MPWRRVSDRLERNGTIAGAGVLVFGAALKFVHPETSDALLLALVAAGAGLIHPSWLVDALRKPPEGPLGPQ